MQLPIDLSVVHRPIRDKYLDEETRELARWFIFGQRPDGTVDVCTSADGQDDVFTHVPPDKAQLLVDARNRFSAVVVAVLNDRPIKLPVVLDLNELMTRHGKFLTEVRRALNQRSFERADQIEVEAMIDEARRTYREWCAERGVDLNLKDN